MIFSTTGIVLKNVKYGDTSGVVTIFTRKFGMQTYMVNGIRTASKSSKAHLYQPGSLLELQVYHNDLKNLQRIREARWLVVYKDIFTSVKKNAVAVLMVELLQKTLQHPEQNDDLFDFCKSVFQHLDDADPVSSSLIPLFFSATLPGYLGFGIDDNFGGASLFFNFKEGNFDSDPDHPNIETDALLNQTLAMILQSDGKNFDAFNISRTLRQRLLRLLVKYYQWHIAAFPGLKTLEVFEQMD